MLGKTLDHSTMVFMNGIYHALRSKKKTLPTIHLRVVILKNPANGCILVTLRTSQGQKARKIKTKVVDTSYETNSDWTACALQDVESYTRGKKFL